MTTDDHPPPPAEPTLAQLLTLRCQDRAAEAWRRRIAQLTDHDEETT